MEVEAVPWSPTLRQDLDPKLPRRPQEVGVEGC